MTKEPAITNGKVNRKQMKKKHKYHNYTFTAIQDGKWRKKKRKKQSHAVAKMFRPQ